ncbi:hypothetical protein LNK15_14180, partial [Jeotgalicoccus huakuii]|nr:hypothetical protein [Jeotgalicoccus huakuii]
TILDLSFLFKTETNLSIMRLRVQLDRRRRTGRGWLRDYGIPAFKYSNEMCAIVALSLHVRSARRRRQKSMAKNDAQAFDQEALA